MLSLQYRGIEDYLKRGRRNEPHLNPIKIDSYSLIRFSFIFDKYNLVHALQIIFIDRNFLSIPLHPRNSHHLILLKSGYPDTINTYQGPRDPGQRIQ